ncbi:MAG: 50S ribosomal protein L29 [Candidatus Woesearchaeota archaeon]|nr:50S ribosomal protein L29 [Candidatus Woesearchaeota archaeon]
MALKTKEIMAMEKSDIEAKILELRRELIKLNAQVHTGTVPKNPGQIKAMKKTIARMLTIINAQKNAKTLQTKEESKKA